MKRIVILLPSYLGGGAETVTDSIVEQLNTRGFEFVLVTSEVIEKCRDHVNALYARVIVTDIDMSLVEGKTTRALADIIRPLQADIVWISCVAYPEVHHLRAALKPGGKVLFHLHCLPYYEAVFKDRYIKAPNHGPDAYYRWYIYKHLKQKYLKVYTWRYRNRQLPFVREVDRYVVLCRSYARQLRLMNLCQARKFAVMYNPAPKSECSVGQKRKELLFLGRLSHLDKRVDNLLKIFSKITDAHPDWTLKIVGDGPDRANLEHLAATLNLKRVEFCGFTSNPEEHLKTASILCLTSDLEGWGMVLVEAMQHGVAPIAFGCSGGVREVLADGRGIIVKPKHLSAYASKLSALMDNEKKRRKICSRHAKFLKKLDINKIADDWERLFNTL